jgi:hypothetical protein
MPFGIMVAELSVGMLKLCPLTPTSENIMVAELQQFEISSPTISWLPRRKYGLTARRHRKVILQ